jgi:hypothetical protein
MGRPEEHERHLGMHCDENSHLELRGTIKEAKADQ